MFIWPRKFETEINLLRGKILETATIETYQNINLGPYFLFQS